MNRKAIILILALAVAGAVIHSPATGADRAGEEIHWQVIAGGGGDAASPSYFVSGTAGQTAVGAASSENYGLGQGFWQSFSPGSCCTLRGDYNDDGSVKVSDLTALIAYLFRGGPPPDCPEHGDCNADGTIKVSDLTLLIAYLFRGGPPPEPC